MPRNAATTPHQLEVMGTFMLENADFAKGRVKANNGGTTTNRLWEQLSENLNSIGPPIKTLDQWKKVWNDYKLKLRKNLREDMLHKRGTGGGPAKESLEGIPAQVADMLNLKTSVQGVGGKTLGHTDNTGNVQATIPIAGTVSSVATESADVIELFDKEYFECPRQSLQAPENTVERAIIENGVVIEPDSEQEAGEGNVANPQRRSRRKMSSKDYLRQESERTAAYRKTKLEMMAKFHEEKMEMKRKYYERKLRNIPEQRQSYVSQDIFENFE